MLTLKFAIKNLIGAGLRTWLNSLTLGISMVIIVMLQGLYQGMEDTMKKARISDEVGEGQYWQNSYDALDPLSFETGHSAVPTELKELIAEGRAAPLLVATAAIYPQGRMQNVTLKGIDPSQNILGIPSGKLSAHAQSDLLILGRRMADQLGIREGELITIRYKTAKGAMDARDFTVAHVFKSNVPAVDIGQLWISLSTLESMLELKDEASIIILGTKDVPKTVPNFKYKSQDELLQDTIAFIKAKNRQGRIIYALLIFVTMISIFDTQVLAVFRRRREIGLLMALGLTQRFIVGLFTVEGLLHGFFAGVLGLIIGTPILSYMSRSGIPLPGITDRMGLAANIIYPVFSWQLFSGTFAIIMAILCVVCYLPVKGISSLQPTQALRGS
ncbi:MAG: ABC transporter permease [Oligoflexales bacterium]|nr:ABC transporter permease [Oligoflexales bacterium]